MSGKPRSAPPAPHGTRARYIWDLRHRRVPCELCVKANRDYTYQRLQLRRAA